MRVALEHLVQRVGVTELRRVDPLERAAITVPALVFEDGAPGGGIGGLLQPAVEGRDDLVAGRESIRAVLTHHLGTHHLVHVRRVELDDRPVQPAGNGRVECGIVPGLVDLAEFEHAAEHVRPAVVRPGAAGHGVVQRR